jgi:microcystin-dependent protein
MPTTYTPNFNLALPEIGASRDTWGSLLNGNTNTLDQYLAYATPVGAVLDFAGPNAPPGWLICDGRLISRLTYSALFAIIGTYWGAGDGSTTFGLPNTPGRTLVGPGTVIDANGTSLSYSFAQLAGVLSAAISQANLPALSLTSNTIAAHSHGGATGAGANHTHSIDVQGDHSHSTDVQGSHAHNYRYTSFSGGGPFSQSGGVAESDVALQTDIQGGHGHNLTTNGAHAHNASYSGNLQLTINPDGSHSHAVPLGGSGAFLNVQNPLLVCTKIIYAGSQASTLALSGPTSQRRLATPLRGGMRRAA